MKNFIGCVLSEIRGVWMKECEIHLCKLGQDMQCTIALPFQQQAACTAVQQYEF